MNDFFSLFIQCYVLRKRVDVCENASSVLERRFQRRGSEPLPSQSDLNVTRDSLLPARGRRSLNIYFAKRVTELII